MTERANKPAPNQQKHSPLGGPRKRRPHKDPFILRTDEVDAIKARCNTRSRTGMRNRCILEVLHKAGLRVSEALALRRMDVEWDLAMIHVRNGKGGKDRTVAVDEATIAWLRGWDGTRPRGETFFNVVRAQASGTGRCTRGGRLRPVYVQQLVRRLARDCAARGLMEPERAEKATPHKFRHAAATELLENGMTVADVQDLLGHANLATTNTYLHARPLELGAKVAAAWARRDAKAEAAQARR
jgi:integrase/recombinase XerD